MNISAGGARIKIAEEVPVASRIHLRFIDDLNLDADAVVCYGAAGAIGVRFTQLTWEGPRIISRPPSLPRRALSGLAVVWSVGLILILWPRKLPNWAPFSKKTVPGLPPPLTTGSSFTLGSSRADVRAAQGSPTSASGEVWSYGSSKVYFKSDRVVGWSHSRTTPLKTASASPAVQAGRNRISVGSSPAEVLAVQGSPDDLSETVWRYGQSEVYFRDGRVVGWHTVPGQPLKTR